MESISREDILHFRSIAIRTPGSTEILETRWKSQQVIPGSNGWYPAVPGIDGNSWRHDRA
eukprot:1174778-Amorphochlora_amoeboformis.AAC.1